MCQFIAKTAFSEVSKLPFANIRFERRKSTIQLKIFVLIAIVLATIAVLVLLKGILLEKRQLKLLRMEAMTLEQKNSHLSDAISKVNTPEGIASIAQQEFGLVYPDTVVFQPD